MTEPSAAADRHGRGSAAGDRAGPSSNDLDRSISLTGERIQAILDAATQAASQIRADAQEDANREADRLTMRRIGEMSRLTDSLIERAESLRNQTDVLAQAMEDAMRALVALPGERVRRGRCPGAAGGGWRRWRVSPLARSRPCTASARTGSGDPSDARRQDGDRRQRARGDRNDAEPGVRD